MNCVEERIWNYIDGNCTIDEQREMDILIATDDEYKRKYHELAQLNIEFACMELDEPSMAFTYNVVESIRTENAQKPLKAAINKNIIRGIAAFFIFSIAALLVFALSGVNWSGGNGVQSPLFDTSVQVPNIANYFNATVVRVFLLADVVLILFLLDSYLRKKLNNKQARQL